MHKIHAFSRVFHAGGPLKIKFHQNKKSHIFLSAFHTTCGTPSKKFKSKVKMEHPSVSYYWHPLLYENGTDNVISHWANTKSSNLPHFILIVKCISSENPNYTFFKNSIFRNYCSSHAGTVREGSSVFRTNFESLFTDLGPA